MPRKVIERSASVASAGSSLMIARRSPVPKVSAPPPAVAKVPVDAPVPKVIVPMGEPFLADDETAAHHENEKQDQRNPVSHGSLGSS